MKIFTLLFLTVSLACSEKPVSIIADGAVLEKLAGDFAFTEGPAADKAGNVYFTDQPNDRILVWTIDEKLTTWMQPSGRSNGLCFDAKGNLWSCADEKNELWHIDQEKQITVLLDNYGGNKLNGPNDVWVAPNGSAFFSDPYYQRPWWDRDTTQQDGQCVYFLSADRQPIKRVVNDLLQPNGIIGTPDGKTLYITDIKDNKTYRYSIGADGSLSGKHLFCEMGSDGMTLDSQGNLYLTNAKGVVVFNPQGIQIEEIKTPEPWTANVCFGGSDMKSLFITAKSGLYRLRMNVSGVGSQ
ncbi:MAG: SMP-30/gluconolactonase/LRE family protein [Cyclobacteriaceae bacterium]|nr:SMP-30/gluconolactonase/LRE family protein [Cyclobacteriaceae bacterium]